MKISDEEIKEKVREQLRWDDRINDIDIFIIIEGGNVKFDGSISNYYAKKLVTKNAKKINGVKSIENNLRVTNLPIPEMGLPSDQELQNTIEQTLNFNVSLDRTKISVSVNEGVVTLEGTVSTHWKKDIVESIVSKFNGVTDIVNNLGIIHFEHDDKQIAKDIIATINRYHNINVDDIDIEVENGRVSISGKVSNWEAYDAALEAINYTHGVKEINKNLIIEKK